MPESSSTLVGRDLELGLLAAFVASVERGPSGLVLTGEAGIGKTALWSRGVELARRAGHGVLWARPTGSEFRLSFAALGDLLADHLDAVLAALPRPQRRALEVALLVEESSEPLDQRAVGVGLLGGLQALARQGPVLVAVDDAQWLDDETARVVTFALRRLRDEPVGLLLARRPESGPSALDPAVALPVGSSRDVDIGPLTVAALHRLIVDRLALTLPRPLLLKVHQASGGNPFYALELAESVRELPLDAGVELPVPESLHELALSRITTLPATARRAVLVVALLPDPRVAVVEKVLGGRRAAGLSIGAAVEAGVVEVAEGRVRFTHPLLGAGAYSAASPSERRALHRRLAEVADDVEARARHLALGSLRPSAAVAATLDEAAGRAFARGAPETAGELWELGLRALPRRDPASARKLQLQAADAWLRAGDLVRYTASLRTLLDALPPGDERAEVMVRLAPVLADSDEGIELIEAARREVESDEAVKALIRLALSMTWPSRGLMLAEEDASAALVHAEASGRQDLVVQALSRIALWRLWAGHDPGPTLARGLTLLEHHQAFRAYDDPRLVDGLWRMYQGRLGDARSVFERLQAEAAESGNVTASVSFELRLADVELRAGAWQRADEHARTGRELAEQIGLEFTGGFALYMHALVGLHLGRLEEARKDAMLGRKLAASSKEVNTVVMNEALLGLADLSLGDDAGVIAHVQPFLDAADRLQLSLAPHPIGPLALHALVAAGRLDEAEARIERFEADARAIASPWARVQGLQSRASLHAARGELAAAIEALEGALALDSGAEWPFERARTLLLLGKTLRRLRRRSAARESLEEARSIFTALPAPLWIDLAEGELRRLGLRRRTAPGLTEGERRVAELAATGLTNREVAGRLFMSPKTVDANLGRVYRKLGIHSRAELGARLGAGPAGNNHG